MRFDRSQWLGRFADRPRRSKIAILGFTSHRSQAPFDDPDWELWPINDLHFELGNVFGKKPVPVDRLRWMQLHPWQELQDWGEPKPGDTLNPQLGMPHPRDPHHLIWLREASKHFPVYLRDSRPELPDCLPFPREPLFQYFTDGDGNPIKYFTNTIVWQTALAIMELCPEPGGRAVDGAEIGIWGVDMMQAGGQGSEYGWQRPSCEWLLGWARGAGITVRLPKESDLLKAAYQYGDPAGEYFRQRIAAYKKDIVGQGNNAQQQVNAARDHLLRMEGAKGALEWIERSHLPGDDGSPQGRAPMPDSHKGLELLLREDGQDDGEGQGDNGVRAE